MMPTIIRQSGPKFQRDGQTITPKALIHTCEVCGADAPFLISSGGKLRSWCGWDGKNPICVNKAKEAEHG